MISRQSEFTFYPHSTKQKPDLLDIAIAKILDFNISIEVLHEMDSDHLPVILSLDKNFDFILTNKPNYSKIDVNKLNKFLEDGHLNLELKNKGDINNSVIKITNLINNAITHSIPKNKNIYKPQSSLPPEIIADIRERNSLRNKFRRTKNKTLKTKINSLRKRIAIKISNMRAQLKIPINYICYQSR